MRIGRQSASAGKPAKKRTNPLATISNLRHILSVHKAAGAVGGAVGGAVDTAGAASRETALLAGRTLLMLRQTRWDIIVPFLLGSAMGVAIGGSVAVSLPEQSLSSASQTALSCRSGSSFSLKCSSLRT